MYFCKFSVVVEVFKAIQGTIIGLIYGVAQINSNLATMLVHIKQSDIDRRFRKFQRRSAYINSGILVGVNSITADEIFLSLNIESTFPTHITRKGSVAPTDTHIAVTVFFQLYVPSASLPGTDELTF